MKSRTAAELAKATGGKILCGSPDTAFENIILDSRAKDPNSLFVPIIGERTDGHLYICKAFENGAVVSLTSRPELADGVHTFVLVEDTRKALQDWGRYIRTTIQIPITAVTGSVGKTSTREMVATALSAGFDVYRTSGNHNGQLGVPIALAEIEDHHTAAVLELGISMPGEMNVIACMAQPDMAVVTNIGVSHIEYLGSREGIAREKLHIIDGMKPDALLILNGDDDMLKKIAPELNHPILWYGQGENSDFRAVNIESDGMTSTFTCKYDFNGKCGELPVSLCVPGIHNCMNALAALAAAFNCGISLEAAAKKLSEYNGFSRRLDIYKKGEVTIIDDTYNASPVSMKACLQVLDSMKNTGRKIAVLADMLELGPDSPKFHREVGSYAAGLGIDQYVCIGRLGRCIGEQIEAESRIPVKYFEDNASAAQFIRAFVKAGDVVGFKGSNGMHLNEIIKEL